MEVLDQEIGLIKLSLGRKLKGLVYRHLRNRF